MPIIKSAIKRARQNLVRRERLQPFRTRMKTVFRQVVDLATSGKKEEARKLLPMAMKVIDTATKKHLLHRNTAARRKSRLARLVA